MDPPQLIDLIEPVIHIQVPTLRIELNKFDPCLPFAVPLPDIGAPSPPMAPPGTARARTSIFCPPCRRTPAARRVFLIYSSTPCIMEASCFSITLWMACTISWLRNPRTLDSSYNQAGYRRSPGPPPCAIHLPYCRRGMLIIERLAPDGR